ncbi:somatostatin receptor type 5-like [Gastrophryne carolinensis]
MESFTEINLDDEMEDFDILTTDNASFFFFDVFNETGTDNKEQSYIFIPFVLVCTLGLVGNALVLYTILRFRKMWTAINVYVFNLALGDIFYMLCLLFFATEIASTYWPLGTSMCKLFWVLISITPFTSIYFLAIMAIHIFIQQFFPEFSKKTLGRLELKIAISVSLIAWVICLLLAIPLFMYADVDSYYNCRILWPDPFAFWNLTFLAYRFVVSFLLPLLLTCIFLIIATVQFLSQGRSTKSSGGVIKENIIMVFALLAVAFVFWLPTHVLEIMSAIAGDLGLNLVSYMIISLIPYLKSLIYPFLYGCLSQSFKEAFRAVFCCKNPQELNSPSNNLSEIQGEKLSAC